MNYKGWKCCHYILVCFRGSLEQGFYRGNCSCVSQALGCWWELSNPWGRREVSKFRKQRMLALNLLGNTYSLQGMVSSVVEVTTPLYPFIVLHFFIFVI